MCVCESRRQEEKYRGEIEDSGRMAQEYVKPKGYSHLRMTVLRRLKMNLSFFLTVNLNLDEVQHIPCQCFTTKAQLLILK